MAGGSPERSLPRVAATLPAVHVAELADLVDALGGNGDALFDELSRDEAAHHDARVTIPALEHAAKHAIAESGEPALGLLLGMKMRVSGHGYLGFAVMTAATVRDAIELASRYAPTRTTALGLRLEVEGSVAALVIDELAPLGAARELVLSALCVGIWQIGNALTGRELEGGADLSFDEPPYFERFAGAAPGPIRFGQPQTQLVFDASILQLPLTQADPAASKLVREHCERDLAAHAAPLVTEARRALFSKGGVRSVAELARALHLSTRTLKRRLAEQGTSYSGLLAERRYERAVLMLRSDASVDEIAAELGYSDAANFTRAFRRWTGTTPAAFRRS